MGLKNPIGEIIRFDNKDHKVIGVAKDMVMQSPYEPVKQTIFYIANNDFDYMIFKINPNISAHEAISKIAAVCKAYSPSVPFSYKFTDEEYAKKFSDEERIGKLASFFAILAIFISCLGLVWYGIFYGRTTHQRNWRTQKYWVHPYLMYGDYYQKILCCWFFFPVR